MCRRPPPSAFPCQRPRSPRFARLANPTPAQCRAHVSEGLSPSRRRAPDPGDRIVAGVFREPWARAVGRGYRTSTGDALPVLAIW